MAPMESRDEAARRAAQEAEAERQRIAAEQRAARESGVMLQVASNAASTHPIAVEPEQVPELPAPTHAADDPNGQQRKNAMVGKENNSSDENQNHRIAPVPTWTVPAGRDGTS